MSTLGLGVIGAGSIGIRGVLQHLCLDDVQDRVRLAAVCDPVPGRARAAAERFHVARHYERYEDLLADPAVDAVTLCTPIGLHFEQGMMAVRARKHLHFNKTMTVTTREATALIEGAAERGLRIVASPGQMLRPVNRRIRGLIQEGAIGRLAWAVTGAAFGDYHEHEKVRQGADVLSNINPAWYWRNPGGGPMYDMTVYGLHTLTGVLGPARRVSGMSGAALKERVYQGRSYPSDAHDNTFLVLDYGEETYAVVYGALAGMVTVFGAATFFGTTGTIAADTHNGRPIDYPGREKRAASRIGDNALLPHVTGSHAEMEEAHVFEDVMQLVDWVRDGTASLATAEHARHVIEIIEAGYRAAQTGRTQELTTSFTPPDGQ